jgi:hypothetical protein
MEKLLNILNKNSVRGKGSEHYRRTLNVYSCGETNKYNVELLLNEVEKANAWFKRAFEEHERDEIRATVLRSSVAVMIGDSLQSASGV